MVGAILTQATSWHNVERAIRRLKSARCLSARALAERPASQIRTLVRSAGYFRQKTERLRTFSQWYRRTYGASARRMFRGPTARVRSELLALNGIGPETADSILLYGGAHPVFVVDTYTRRVFGRHGLIRGDEPYEAIQQMVMDRLPAEPTLFNEFHALIVAAGKQYCHRHHPDCAACPLGSFPTNLEVTTHG